MTDLERLARIQFTDGLLGYLELRHWAFAAIAAVTPPADGADMRRNHYLYFSSLFGIVDLVKDYVGAPDDAAFEQQIRASFPQPDDYFYTRTLRNVIVHAGVDPTMLGTVENGFVRALCPPLVYGGRRKKLRSYSCSIRLMVDLAIVADAAVNPAVLAVFERENLLDASSSMLSLGQIHAEIATSGHMPDWAKSMAIQMLAGVDYEAMARTLALHRVDRLRTLLKQA